MEEEERVTIRIFIELLARAAGNLPEGLDSAIELAICDGTSKQFIDHVEADHWYTVNQETGRVVTDGERGVYIIGHWHPGEGPGKVYRGIAADVDEELRKLSGE